MEEKILGYMKDEQTPREVSIWIEPPEKDGISLKERRSSAFMISAACKEDKLQMNRIEKMLKRLLQSKQGKNKE